MDQQEEKCAGSGCWRLKKGWNLMDHSQFKGELLSGKLFPGGWRSVTVVSNTSWCPGRELEVTQGALTSSFGFDLLLRPGQTSCFSVYLFELTQFPFLVK